MSAMTTMNTNWARLRAAGLSWLVAVFILADKLTASGKVLDIFEEQLVGINNKKIGSEGHLVKLESVADESKHVGCHACSACEGWCRSWLVRVVRVVRKTSLLHRYAWLSLHAVSPQLLGSCLTAVACVAFFTERESGGSTLP